MSAGLSSVEVPTGTAAYRTVLRLPGVAALTAVGLLLRMPASAAALVLTLHVVLELGYGYAAAGLVGSAATIGMAIGAPLLGRLIDRRGLRTMLVLGVAAEIAFWFVAPVLSYPALLVGAFLVGLLGIPVFSVVRQAVAAAVPSALRRPAFAMDSMSVELSYIVAPALGSVLVLALSGAAAMWTIGTAFVIAGAALWILNPPTRTRALPVTDAPASVATSPVDDAERGRGRPTWLDRRLVAALIGTSAAVFVVFGVELAMVAGLERSGQAGWIAAVTAVWAAASLVGGFTYGAIRRSPAQAVLLTVLGLATLPVALAGVWWSWLLLLIPAGLACAPVLAAGAGAVSDLAPERIRGLVTGLHGSATTLGGAIAGPVAGLLIDLASPSVAVLVVGGVGAVAGVALVALTRTRHPAAVPG